MNTDICNITIKFFKKSLFTIVIKITVLHFYFYFFKMFYTKYVIQVSNVVGVAKNIPQEY